MEYKGTRGIKVLTGSLLFVRGYPMFSGGWKVDFSFLEQKRCNLVSFGARMKLES